MGGFVRRYVWDYICFLINPFTYKNSFYFMKKCFILLTTLLIGFTAQAQEFKPFKVNISLGAALPSGGGGVLFALEPKYGIND